MPRDGGDGLLQGGRRGAGADGRQSKRGGVVGFRILVHDKRVCNNNIIIEESIIPTLFTIPGYAVFGRR